MYNKNFETCQNTENDDSYIGENKQATETACEQAQMCVLTNKDFKIAVINIFEELKETMVKEVRKIYYNVPLNIK